VHIRAGMIGPTCAFIYVCIHVWAWLCLHVHTRALNITPISLSSTWACGKLRAQDKTTLDQFEMHDSVYAHTCTSMLMRHSVQLFSTKEGTKLGHFHGNNQARPCTSHVFSTGSKGTAMQKPGNNAKAFGLSPQVVHKHREQEG
jgi:hypothetical protein